LIKNEIPSRGIDMPVYDYRCKECRKRFEVFMSYSEYGVRQVVCPKCGSDNIQRRIGRVRIARSDESRLESFDDPSGFEGLENDPQEMGRMMRKMSGELGEDMGPEFDEVVGRLERGQSPEEIERDMPELGEESDSGGGDLDF
jgi:putative FmdB family regulatory protein